MAEDSRLEFERLGFFDVRLNLSTSALAFRNHQIVAAVASIDPESSCLAAQFHIY